MGSAVLSDGQRRQRSVFAVATVAMLAVIALSGCTAALGPSRATASARSASVTSQRPPKTTATPGPATANGIVATGQFGSPDGTTSGTVTVSLQNSELILHVDGFRTTAQGSLQFQLSPWAPSTPCLADEHSLILGRPGLRQVGIGSLATDPSFYKTVVMTRAPTPQNPTDTNGCVFTPVAFAPISWTLPDTHPDLSVRDSGSMAGARGTATVVSGAPSSYVVADGDNLSSIAARFGISLDDLLFLNPMDSMPLWAGQHLNLSKALRGAGSVPAPCSGQC